MANYQQLFAQAQQTIASVAGVQVTFSRGSASVEITAVPAVSNFDTDGDQIITEYRTRDFIIVASDLILNDAVVTPQRGDVITETVGTALHNYQVGRPQGGNEQPWRYTDTGRSNIRIHTMLQGVV